MRLHFASKRPRRMGARRIPDLVRALGLFINTASSARGRRNRHWQVVLHYSSKGLLF
jgi:hypothetical protein